MNSCKNLNQNPKNSQLDRRTFVQLGAACLASGVLAGAPALSMADGVGLSLREVNDRIRQIREDYEIGQKLSPEDAAFIKKYSSDDGPGFEDFISGFTDFDAQVMGSVDYDDHTYQISGNTYARDRGDGTFDCGGVIQAGCATKTCGTIELHMSLTAFIPNGNGYELVGFDFGPHGGRDRNWFASEFYDVLPSCYKFATISAWAGITLDDGKIIHVEG